jgi:AAA+ ATPase superfamily predicted ATPase
MNIPSHLHENPFVFGEIVDETNFVNREQERAQLIRDLADGQKVFLLSPRRFGKSSLVSIVLRQLNKRYIRTVNLNVSSYASYVQFLEKFAEKVLQAAGPWEKVKDWVGRFGRMIQPSITLNMATGQISVSLGRGAAFDPEPIASEVFEMPGVVARHGGFRMAICLDEFQQIREFGGVSVENALRNAVQEQREVGYVFAGSQPSLMKQMLSPKRPFYKAGPQVHLDKISAADWTEFIVRQFRKRERALEDAGVDALLAAADLIPYDVQRIAHELWDVAELKHQKQLGAEDVDSVVQALVAGQSTMFEQLWEQLTARQRAALQAMAARGPAEIYSQAVREEFRLGPASSVQKSLQLLNSRDILDHYKGSYFFLDPLLPRWIRKKTA